MNNCLFRKRLHFSISHAWSTVIMWHNVTESSRAFKTTTRWQQDVTWKSEVPFFVDQADSLRQEGAQEASWPQAKPPQLVPLHMKEHRPCSNSSRFKELLPMPMIEPSHPAKAARFCSLILLVMNQSSCFLNNCMFGMAEAQRDWWGKNCHLKWTNNSWLI